MITNRFNLKLLRTLKVSGTVAFLLFAVFHETAFSEPGFKGDYLNRKIEIRIYSGWSLYRMAELNDYLGEIYGEGFENGPEFRGEIGYYLNPRTAINLGITYIENSIRGSYIRERPQPDGYVFTEKMGDYSFDLSMQSLSLILRYRFPVRNVICNAALGQSVCFGKLHSKFVATHHQAISYDNSYTSIGVGFTLSGGADYRVSKFLSIGIESGYRYLKTDDLEDQLGRNRSTYPEKGGMGLDFSGPFISANVAFSK